MDESVRPIPLPLRKGRFSILNVGYVRRMVNAINAFINLKVQTDAEANELIIGDGSAILCLKAQATGTGGSSGPRLYRIKSVERNFLVCRTWDGTSEGATDAFIQRNWKLTWAVASETIRGVLWNYAYDNADYQHRTATGSNGVVEEQYVTPDYLVNDLIYASTATALFLNNASVPITLKDDNDDGRAWATRE